MTYLLWIVAVLNFCLSVAARAEEKIDCEGYLPVFAYNGKTEVPINNKHGWATIRESELLELRASFRKNAPFAKVHPWGEIDGTVNQNNLSRALKAEFFTDKNTWFKIVVSDGKGERNLSIECSVRPFLLKERRARLDGSSEPKRTRQGKSERPQQNSNTDAGI